MRARAAAVAAAAAVALSGCAGLGGSTLPSGPVAIGLVTSLTGIGLPLGADVRLGAEQAVAEVNAAGGVDGHSVKLLVGDDQSTAAGATTAATALLAKKVAGLVGPVRGETAEAVAGAVASRRTPLLPAWGADSLAAAPNVFLVAPPASRAAERMLAYASSAKLSTLAVAHPTGDAYADAGVRALAAGAAHSGVSLVLDQPFDPGAVDFTALIAAVRSANASLLLVWGEGSGPPLLERAWKPSGLQAPILLSPASASSDFLRAVSYSGEGALLVATKSLLAGAHPSPMAAAFQAANGYYPSQAAFDGYAGARLLLAAVASAGSTDPKAVDAALAGLRLTTAAGPYSYSGKDHLGLPASWLSVAVIRDGKLSVAG